MFGFKYLDKLKVKFTYYLNNLLFVNYFNNHCNKVDRFQMAIFGLLQQI